MINLHVSGSVLPLGKMELNPVVGLVLISKATTVSDNKPSLADLDSDTDSEDDQGKFLDNVQCRMPSLYCYIVCMLYYVRFQTYRLILILVGSFYF